MICIRENCFDEVTNNDNWKIFQNNNKQVVIIYNPDSIADVVKWLNDTDSTCDLKIYVFSYGNDTYDSDFSGLTVKFELVPILENILEVYRRIFTLKEGNE